jgi:hypothetical protein
MSRGSRKRKTLLFRIPSTIVPLSNSENGKSFLTLAAKKGELHPFPSLLEAESLNIQSVKIQATA